MHFHHVIYSLLAAASVVFAANSTSPVNPKADAATKNLLAYLATQSASGNTLSGVQGIESVRWVATNVGKSPGLLGSDFINYSPAYAAHGASSQAVEDAISYHKAGGVVTFSWHWGSPSGEFNNGSQPWYRSFYTEATSFDVEKAMADTNSNDYKLLVRDIDAISEQMKRLADAGVPVLWRPLHEAEGGWFWWGAKGAEPCKKLYSLMYDRMTNYHGLNNLLWVWNSVDTEWYPGNSTVDIVTADVYSTTGDHSSQLSTYQKLQNLSGDSKVIALAEVANIPDPVNVRKDGTKWAYWMVWDGDFIQGESYNSLSYKKTVFSDNTILNQDEVAISKV